GGVLSKRKTTSAGVEQHLHSLAQPNESQSGIVAGGRNCPSSDSSQASRSRGEGIHTKYSPSSRPSYSTGLSSRPSARKPSTCGCQSAKPRCTAKRVDVWVCR